MGLYPVKISITLVLDQRDGRIRLFWGSMGGGWALAKSEECRHQIGEAARVIAASEQFFHNTETTFLTADVNIYPEKFDIDTDSISQSSEYTMEELPYYMQSKEPSLVLDNSVILTDEYKGYFE